MKKVVFLILSLSICSVFASAYTIENIPNPKKTDNKNYVSNPDNIITTTTVKELNKTLISLENETRTEVAVVLVKSINNQSVELFANELFSYWGVGKSGDNNGLLILFVEDNKEIRFETGYGIEGVLPDAKIARIQREHILPYFKKGDYDQGFIRGIQALSAVLKDEKFEKQKEKIAWNVVLPVVLGFYLLILLLSFVLINNAIKKAKNDDRLRSNISKYIAIKSSRKNIVGTMNLLIIGLGFLFITFLFKNIIYLIFLIGVPLAILPANLYARFMMWRIRRQAINCPECEGEMRLLSEKKEDDYLKLSQQFEEELGSIDYDVFLCQDCGNEAIFTLDKPSPYTECPSCKTKAFGLHQRKVIVHPTYVNGGSERITYRCKFCGYEENDNKRLPRLNRGSSLAAGTAAGSIMSGRGGFGGGGFSGGSFGGGMSGGGGATGRW